MAQQRVDDAPLQRGADRRVHAALEKIRPLDKSLATLRREHEEAKRMALEGESHPTSPISHPAKKDGLALAELTR